jgi:hypothetical protein
MSEDSSEPTIAESRLHTPPNLLLFDKWDATTVQVNDVGLVRYISLKPTLVPHTSGRHAHKRFHKSQ